MSKTRKELAGEVLGVLDGHPWQDGAWAAIAAASKTLHDEAPEAWNAAATSKATLQLSNLAVRQFGDRLAAICALLVVAGTLMGLEASEKK